MESDMLTINTVVPVWKPMTAGTIEPPVDFSGIKFPVYCSHKLDGVRATIQGGRVLSRALKEIPNRHVQRTFGRAGLEGLDGELIVGSPTAEDCYRKTVSATMTREGEPPARFFVFD